MGVTIRAYSQLELTPAHEYQPEDCYEADHIRAFVLAGLEYSLRGAVAERCYEKTALTEFHRIADWSYLGYSRWREKLCEAVNGYLPRVAWDDPDHHRDDPLFELVHFADNEGCIGPAAAASLLDDFNNHAAKLDHLANYYDWLRGLKLAAAHGLIEYS
jgi:hypothetical protein